MKTLYLELNMGAAGDMLLAALLELVPDPDAVIAQLNALGLPGVNVSGFKVTRNGIEGTRVEVAVNGEVESSEDVPLVHDPRAHSHPHDDSHAHAHEHESHAEPHHHGNTLAEVEATIKGLALPPAVIQDALAVYQLLAEAESQAHGKPVLAVHFHEVGMLDAIIDIVGVCYLMHQIAPDKVSASPVNVGSGQVRTSHGILPVPAPATAILLQGVPIYSGEIRAELCTPTGAALLKHFVQTFEPMPPLRAQAIGYGFGKKEFTTLNAVRAFLGDGDATGQTITELACNLDDMTPEAIAYAQEVLFDHGALDVYTTPIGMKKSRPSVLLTCLCANTDADKLADLMLRHTSTFGVRKSTHTRYTLNREVTIRQTRFGPVRFKHGFTGEISKSKPEYEDLAKIAQETGKSLAEIIAELDKDLN